MGKKKKELGFDSDGAKKVMRKRDYMADMSGQWALGLMANVVGQLTYFYTDKVGLAVGGVGIVMAIAKVIDALTDIWFGNVIEHSKGGNSKFYKWMFRMMIPAAVITFLMFTVPKGQTIGMIYVLVTNVLLTAVIYTMIATPFGAVMVVRTNSQVERSNMGIFRAVGNYGAGMIISIIIIPVTNMLGGTQSAWIKVAVVFSLISLLSLLILYKTSKENVQIAEKSEDENVPFVEGIKILFKNKYWVIMLALQFLMNISYSLSASGGTYYAKYILGNDNIVALLGAVGLIPTFLGFILTGPMASKLGMTKTCMISCAMGAVACLVRVFTPYSLMTCVVGGAVATFANIPLMCLFGAMVNNCVEYNDYKFGKRIVGMTNSANSFGMKIGSGIGASLIGWLLAAAGYNAALAAQPASVDTAIFTFGIYIPLALFVIMFILLLKNDLEKRYPEIVAELQKRKEAK